MFQPRTYQLEHLLAPLLVNDAKRILCLWHRRAGKDKTAFVGLVEYAATKRVGNYFYVFPTYAQARKALWTNIDAEGRALLDHIDPDWIVTRNDAEMFLRLANGSTVQVIGAAATHEGRGIDAVVGSNPVGLVYSELSLMPQRVWDLMRPVVAENGGFVVFLYTPRGRNWTHALYEQAKSNPAWHVSTLTVDDTRRADGSPVVSQAAIDEDRASGMPDDLIQQEYYCSFAAALVGAYYGALMEAAEREGRVQPLPVEDVSTYTSWDIGRHDKMAIWFWQEAGPWRHYIDYLEDFGKPLQHYAVEIQRRGYLYATHYLPHDIRVTDLTQEVTREEILRRALKGSGQIEVVPRVEDVADRIAASRLLLPKCRFDRERTKAGREALAHYRTEYDEVRRQFGKNPLHDWASDGADAFGTGAMVLAPSQRERRQQERREVGWLT